MKPEERKDTTANSFVIAISAVLLLVLFGGFVVLLWGLGLFDAQTRTSNSQAVAAALALGGALVAASLTFVGVLLKHSIDKRTLRQQRETESRLRLETSIRAVELLTEGGVPAARSRQAGALFALASLDQLDFAIALLQEVWRQRQIHPAAAVWVVNRALVNGDKQIQWDAATLLLANAEELIQDTEQWWFPASMDGQWTTDVAENARETLLSVLLAIAALRSYEEWKDGSVNSMVWQLDTIRQSEPAAHIRNGAVLFLELLLDSPRYKEDRRPLLTPTGELDISRLLDEVKRLAPTARIGVTQQATAAIEALRPEWTPRQNDPEEGAP